MLKAYLEKYEAVRQQEGHLRPYLVTLTVKNGDGPDERLRHLRAAMRRMTQARRDHHSNSENRFVEFARSMGGFHFH